jgi:predicted RND superfamily exporter protein
MKRYARMFVDTLVDLGARRPWLVLLCAFGLLVATWTYTRKLEVRSDLLELLPRDSPGFQAFERRLDRIGGRATITVVAQSPNRDANEHFIDELDTRLEQDPRGIAWIESGTKKVRAFFEAHKWLYAHLPDLEEADATLDRQIAIKSGLVEDLLDENARAEPSLGLSRFKDRWKKEADERDDFPRGYFESPDGTQVALRIMSTARGVGGKDDEQLFARVKKLAHEVERPADMQVGFGGDIPNTAAEKDSLVHEAVIATGIAAVMILVALVWFYGSPWALLVLALPPIFGVSCAYAFATWKYGYVNSSGVFLGAIILGNGINYPIVLYSRYKEFRARGMEPAVARRDAVWNAFRAELVGSSVASIAYGSLMVTRFRGFNQFGVIGFVGMLLVWIAMIPCLPAVVVLVERLQERLPGWLGWLRERPATLDEEGARGPVSRFVAHATARWPHAIVAVAAVVTCFFAVHLPAFIRDPWEYDFDRLGSKSARTNGAYHWSGIADRILSGKMNLSGALVLADHPDQVKEVKERILANDAADPQGSLIESISTLDDFLPSDQEAKLEVLERLRSRLTPRVMSSLSPEERKTVEEMIPPEDLQPIQPEDLPELVKKRFSERNGTLGTIFYIRYRPTVSRNDGHVLLRQAATIDGVRLPDGTRVDTASRATVFAEMIKSLERDGPLATVVSFMAVVVVVILATSSRRGALSVILSLLLGVTWMLGTATLFGGRLNFLNFIALPITFGIGTEYPFNIFDRSRLLNGDVSGAVKLSFGAVVLCSYTTAVGYGSLLFADNQALQSFGRFAIAGEIACIVAAVVFLPALLHLLAHRVRRPVLVSGT